MTLHYHCLRASHIQLRVATFSTYYTTRVTVIRCHEPEPALSRVPAEPRALAREAHVHDLAKKLAELFAVALELPAESLRTK